MAGGSGSEGFTMSASGLSSKNPPHYLMKLNSLTDKVHSFDYDFQLDLLLEEDTQCFIGQQRR